MSGPRPPMELGDVLDYDSYRVAARTLVKERQRAVERFERQAEKAADAEASYQRIKAQRMIALKADESVSSTEAVARVKGDDKVSAAMIDRDYQTEVTRARREDIAGVDEASAHLRRIAAWSQSLADLSGNRGVTVAA